MINYPPYFQARELQCRCQDATCAGKTMPMDTEFMQLLTAAREMAQIPFTISSGARCAEHNKKVGGAENSAHIATLEHRPCAVDIRCDGKSAYIIVKACMRIGLTGIGVSQKGEPKFIHVDNKQDSKNCTHQDGSGSCETCRARTNRPFLWSY